MRMMKRVMAGGVAVATGLVLLPSAPASAAGGRCDGHQVRTCVSVGVKDGYRVRARSSVTDVKGGSNFSVRTTQTHLQQKYNGRWHNIGVNVKDHDGWHAAKDKARTRRVHCHGNGYMVIRARAHFDWKRVGTDGQWMNSTAVRVPCVVHV